MTGRARDPVRRFTGGGSLDGAAREIPAGVRTACTIDRGGRSFYELDDAGGSFRFIGYGREGEMMGRLARVFSETARREQEAIAEASRARGCGSCGGVFADAASFTIHRDPGWPGGCLPEGALGQLVEVDGVWQRPGSSAARG